LKKRELFDRSKDGMVLTLTDRNEENVTFDGNHPLAGEDPVFDIETVDVL
jgi:FKBP-type peptidyl-prolyl cis-trans isomerase 2